MAVRRGCDFAAIAGDHDVIAASLARLRDQGIVLSLDAGAILFKVPMFCAASCAWVAMIYSVTAFLTVDHRA